MRSDDSGVGQKMQGVTSMGMLALAVRFIVELLGVVAIAYWGWQAGPEGIGRIALAVAAAAALIVVWAFVVAPKAANPLSQSVRDLVGTVLLLVAAAALAAGGGPRVAVIFAAVVVVDWLAMLLLGRGAVDAAETTFRPSAATRR
jgi:Protein of unknown function (DUF2568)